MEKLYYRQVDLQQKFDIGATFCNKVCRLIDNNEDIYSGYSKIGTKYHICAFLHAYKHWQDLESGRNVPPFQPEVLGKLVMDQQERDAEEAAKYAEHKLRTDIVIKIIDWFNVTAIPRGLCDKRLLGIIKKAMVAIVTE